MRHLSLLALTAAIAISTFGCSQGSLNTLPTSPDVSAAAPVVTDDITARDLTGGPVGCAGDMLVTNTYPSLNGKDFTTSGLLSLKLCNPRDAAITWTDFSNGRTFTTTLTTSGAGVWKGSWNTKVATPLRVTQETGVVSLRIIEKSKETVVTGTAGITTIVTTMGSKGQPGSQRVSEQKFTFAGISK